MNVCLGATFTDGEIFQPGPRSRAAAAPVPVVARPPCPLAPLKFSGLIERVLAPDRRYQIGHACRQAVERARGAGLCSRPPAKPEKARGAERAEHGASLHAVISCRSRDAPIPGRHVTPAALVSCRMAAIIPGAPTRHAPSPCALGMPLVFVADGQSVPPETKAFRRRSGGWHLNGTPPFSRRAHGPSSEASAVTRPLAMAVAAIHSRHVRHGLPARARIVRRGRGRRRRDHRRGHLRQPVERGASAPHAALIVLAWSIGGGLALVGGFIWAELGSRFPFVGGQYVYLTRAYPPIIGFLYGVALLFIINGGSLAAVAILFASYVDRSFVRWDRRASACVPRAVLVAFTAVKRSACVPARSRTTCSWRSRSRASGCCSGSPSRGGPAGEPVSCRGLGSLERSSMALLLTALVPDHVRLRGLAELRHPRRRNQVTRRATSPGRTSSASSWSSSCTSRSTSPTCA